MSPLKKFKKTSSKIGKTVTKAVDSVSEITNNVSNVSDIPDKLRNFQELFSSLLSSFDNLNDGIVDVKNSMKSMSSQINSYDNFLKSLDEKTNKLIVIIFNKIPNIISPILAFFEKIAIYLNNQLKISEIIKIVLGYYVIILIIPSFFINTFYITKLFGFGNALPISAIITILLTFFLFAFIKKILPYTINYIRDIFSKINFTKIINNAINQAIDEIKKL
jgi:hypothetical protein